MTPSNGGDTRLYRSLENIHWATVADSNLYTHCRSVDSEFILHCKSTSHWSEGSIGRPPFRTIVEACRHMPINSERMPIHKDLPAYPFARVPQWLFPSADERVLHGDAKRELKEKLRLHSSKVTEPIKPVRPQAFLNDFVASEFSQSRTCQQCKNGGALNCGAVYVDHGTITHSQMPLQRQRSSLCPRITCPEDIKQEAMRRFHLRRQNSSPNLTLHQAENRRSVVKSKTAESLKDCGYANVTQASSPELNSKGCCKGRLYIPTFEEFKRMRSRNSSPGSRDETLLVNQASFRSQPFNTENNENACLSLVQTISKHTLANNKTINVEAPNEMDNADRCSKSVFHLQNDLCSSDSINCNGTSTDVNQGLFEDTKNQNVEGSRATAPICSSPVPRSPLQGLAVHRQEEDCILHERTAANGNSVSEIVNAADGRLVSEAQSSCCPSLLLEATDLSGYGAKLQKMKNEIIGSAMDLLKKSCSAETNAEPAAEVSCDSWKADILSEEDSGPSIAIPMATLHYANESDNETPADMPPAGSHTNQSCRRSSSDIAHETADTSKTPRECRLRPHFSDPMPTDAVKRKQLEMKIAAAARLHAHRRRQEKDGGPVLAKASSTDGRSFEKDTTSMPSYSQRSRNRWSNLSSLSTDSGIVGISDEKDDTETSSTRSTKSVAVERTDSGIGHALANKWRNRAAETMATLEAWEAYRPCTDCGERECASENEAQSKRRDNLCEKCLKRRTERKEAVLEFINTESSYGEDLRIIKEEFYVPMQSAGLLTQEQLSVVFSNIQELIDLNEKFLECLQEEIDQAFDQEDDDLITVCIGEIFLEFVNMLPSFQTYCLQQSASVNMLNTLEKEKELLRIFLNVSQNDNIALRRMNLRSFLMAPLQRVTKYPLLLSRIINSTIEYHPDHSSLWEAKSRIESHLEHINMKTKQEGNSWTLRSFRRESRKNREVINIEIRETAIKTVGWLREETRFIMEGSLQLAQPTDGHWVRKGSKVLKFQNLQVLLMANMRRQSESSLEGMPPDAASHQGPVKDAVLVLIRDKSNGKFSLLREPLRLSNCVVSADPDCDDTFELLEIRREAFVFRDGDKARTHHWFRQIKRYSRELGSWKKRRNALPNIMISTTQSRF
ncbi:hypothetical protein NDU88_001088 [Pleurodeles waltl]|uniref:DH domain-containing protein n=2 Tax=Pleurodeles waltl TaxID=8319 RepID=A0AAV7TGT8_PLEWA|nr:hypothetical protein NDU88_001088 [Pleurodeles waltl]